MEHGISSIHTLKSLDIDLHVSLNLIEYFAIHLFQIGFNSTGHRIRTCSISIRG